MSEQDGLNPAEREVEAALRSLAPAAARVDPVAAAFEAGRRSARGRVRLWQMAGAAMLLVTVASWLMPSGLREFGWRERMAVAPGARAAGVPGPPAAQSLLMLRQAVWEKGVDGLPAVQLPPAASSRGEAFSTLRGES